MSKQKNEPSAGTYWLHAASIALVLRQRSTEESRPILNGLFLRDDGVAVCTNGHTLGLVRDAHNLPESLILSVSKELDKLVAAVAKSKILDTLEVELPKERTHVLLRAPGVSDITLTVPLIEGPYPNVAQVFPKGDPVPVRAIGLDTGYLERHFGGHAAFTFYGEGKAILVSLRGGERKVSGPVDRYVGLLMPVRIEEEIAGAPAWVERDLETLASREPPAPEPDGFSMVDWLTTKELEDPEFLDALNAATAEELEKAVAELGDVMDEERRERAAVLQGTRDSMARVAALLTAVGDEAVDQALKAATDDELEEAEMLADPMSPRLRVVQRELRQRQEGGDEAAPEPYVKLADAETNVVRPDEAVDKPAKPRWHGWVTIPANDLNFKAALERATKEELVEALAFMGAGMTFKGGAIVHDGSKHTGRIKAVERELKKRGDEEREAEALRYALNGGAAGEEARKRYPVPCTRNYCNAPVGEPCRSAMGNLTTTHSPRIKDAKEQGLTCGSPTDEEFRAEARAKRNGNGGNGHAKPEPEPKAKAEPRPRAPKPTRGADPSVVAALTSNAPDSKTFREALARASKWDLLAVREKGSDEQVAVCDAERYRRRRALARS